MTVLLNPLQIGPLVLVAAVGEAEGSWGAAAALACASAEVDSAPLLIDVGGRTPRPTLIASAAAQKLESRLKAQLPDAKVAARGQVCHLAVGADCDELETAVSAAATARESGVVVHVPPQLLYEALVRFDAQALAVLLRADLQSDRSLVALAVRDLIERGVAAAVLKRRLTWIAERRALFGVLPSGAAGGLPERLVRQLTGASR
jgi:Arc/MetJ family transcription regulator